MSTIHQDVAAVLARHRFKYAPGTRAGIIKTALAKGDEETLHEWLPSILATHLETEAANYREGKKADEKFEAQAHDLARNAAFDLRRNLELVEANASKLSVQHLAGLDRMGTGRRPTAAAVAGAAVGDTFQARRLLERAIEIQAEL